MSDIEHIIVTKHIPIDELEHEIRIIDSKITGLKKMERMKTKLQFIRLKYKGYGTVQAADIFGINHQTAYNWLNAWNESGMGSIEPRFTGGPKARLNDEQRSKLFNWVERDQPTTKEVMEYLERNYNIAFSESYVTRLLKGMGFNHSKPYLIDRRRSDDCEEVLKKTSTKRWMLSETENSSSDSKTNP